jgi:hypothetical protein
MPHGDQQLIQEVRERAANPTWIVTESQDALVMTDTQIRMFVLEQAARWTASFDTNLTQMAPIIRAFEKYIRTGEYDARS